MRKKMSEGGVPLVIKSIGIDAVPLAGEELPLALMTLTDSDDIQAEYFDEPARRRHDDQCAGKIP